MRAVGVTLAAAASLVAPACGGGAEPSGGTPSWTPAAAPGTIVTVLGGAAQPLAGVEGMPTEIRLNLPVDLAFDPHGNLYVAERYNHRIVKVDPEGTVSVAAGIVDEGGWAQNGFSGDGGPASEATLNQASTIAAGPDGSLYIGDAGNNRIRKIDADGTITTVAGNGKRGFSGDGGPAVEASLDNPLGLAVDPEANLYFLDAGNYRIRKIDTHGVITTVAGRGELGFSPDGTLATEALMGDPTDHMPMGLALTPAGELVFTDMGNRTIRLIDSSGRLRTLADGDDFPAGDVVGDPLDVAVGPDGTVYVSAHTHSSEGNVVYLLRNGKAVPLAGGTSGYSGDGGPAAKAQLDIPAGIEVGPDGDLYVADARNNVVRMIAMP